MAEYQVAGRVGSSIPNRLIINHRQQGCIDRVASLSKDLDPDPRRIRVLTGDHAVATDHRVVDRVVFVDRRSLERLGLYAF